MRPDREEYARALTQVKATIKARRADVALAGSAAMIMHLAWSAGYWKQEITARVSGGRSIPSPVLPFAAS